VEGNVPNAGDPNGMYFWTGRGEGNKLSHDLNRENRNNIHTRIQALAMAPSPSTVHAEYPLPLASLANIPDIFNANEDYVYIDLLREDSGEIWEIKPKYDQALAFVISHAQVEIMAALQKANLLTGRYPTGMPYDWNTYPRSWLQGASFSKVPVFLGTDDGGWFSFYAQQTLPGAIIWWKVRNERQRLLRPIALPGDIVWNPDTDEQEHPDPVLDPYGGGVVTNPVPAYSGLTEPICTASCHVPGYTPRPQLSPEASRRHGEEVLAILLLCGVAFIAPQFLAAPILRPVFQH
jgi:hypothetical protein